MLENPRSSASTSPKTSRLIGSTLPLICTTAACSTLVTIPAEITREKFLLKTISLAMKGTLTVSSL